MTELPASLVELARRYGVATEYEDWTGRHTTVADTTLIAVLDALGVSASTEGERTAALRAHDRDHWARALPPAIVGRSGVASSFWVHVTHGDPAGLWLRLEDGAVRTGPRQLQNNQAPYDLDGPPGGGSKTTGPFMISMADGRGRRPSNCPPPCRSDITSCIFRSARPTSAR